MKNIDTPYETTANGGAKSLTNLHGNVVIDKEIQDNKRRTMRSAASVPNLGDMSTVNSTFGKKMSAPNASAAYQQAIHGAFSQPDLVGAGEITRDSM